MSTGTYLRLLFSVFLFWVAFLLLIFLLARTAYSQEVYEPVSQSRVFVGWLLHADQVRIYLKNGDVLNYSGKRFEELQQELDRAIALYDQEQKRLEKEKRKKKK